MTEPSHASLQNGGQRRRRAGRPAHGERIASNKSREFPNSKVKKIAVTLTAIATIVQTGWMTWTAKPSGSGS